MSTGLVARGIWSTKNGILSDKKNLILGSGDRIHHLTKKFINQKSSGSMSLWRSTSTSGGSDKTENATAKKLIFEKWQYMPKNAENPNLLLFVKAPSKSQKVR